MTILEAIRSAVERGELTQPFDVNDVAAALKDHCFSPGSLQATLSRSSRPDGHGPEPPLRRVGPGMYRLTRAPHPKSSER